MSRRLAAQKTRAEQIAGELSEAIRAWAQSAADATPKNLHDTMAAVFAIYERHRKFLLSLHDQAVGSGQAAEVHQILISALHTHALHAYERLRMLGKLRAGATPELVQSLVYTLDILYRHHLRTRTDAPKPKASEIISHIYWHSLYYGQPRKRQPKSPALHGPARRSSVA